MTNTGTQTTGSAAQAILTDTRAIRTDLNTILRLAEATALPKQGEQVSFLETTINLLRMIVEGVEQNQKSLASLHQKLDDPGIAMVLRRAMETD